LALVTSGDSVTVPGQCICEQSSVSVSTSVRPIMISDIGHIGINPRYRRSDGNCPLISDVCNLKRALYNSLI